MKTLSTYQDQIPSNKLKEALRPFGNGPKVSIFTLGTMRAINSSDQMYAVLKASSQAGINHIETSPAYGAAEKFLGKALKRIKQESLDPKGGWIITSKLLPGVSLKKSKENLQTILKNLGLEKIDNLAIHGLNTQEHLEWSLHGEGSEFLKWAVDCDLIGQVGFSSHGSYALIQKAIESNRFQFCSLHLHLLDPKRIPLAKIALKKGMGVMAISPSDKGGRLQDPSLTLINDCSPFSPLELAYKYLLDKGISTLTIGAFEPKDLDLAKKIVSSFGPLQLLEKTSIDNLQEQGTRRLGVNLCGQCEACLPCPKSVPIPSILHLRNLLIGHDLEAFTQERYNLIGKAGHWWESINASACEECKECIPRCPNNLPIPKLLKETHQRLADRPRRRLWG